jgi:DNA polymerase elongation subunit (family B)
MLSGNILDVYPDYKRNVMVIWLIHDGRAIRIEDTYEPSFYVYAQHDRLHSLSVVLQDLPQVKQLNFTSCKTVLGSDKHKMVLEVVPKNLGSLNKLATMIDSWGGYHDYQLFNVDIRLPTRYLQSKGVFCNAHVRWDGKYFVLDDEQWSIDYEIPSFKTVYFDIKRKTKGICSFNDPISSIVINDYTIEGENESDTILSAVKYIRQVDPDIIYTVKGDSTLFPFLYHRARLHGINNQVNLSRDSARKKKHLQPVKKAKSYFSYGRIIYRPAFYTLKGRVHIDTSSSFLYGESGLRGLIDISRCSNIPLQLLSRLGPGTAISQIQVNKAMEKGFLIPWKKNMPETWKTAMSLLVSDRGGLILEPVVGLHEDIVELDFASLYPNIMLNHNISPETMLCDCCPDSPNRVPQLGYHICVRHKGLIPEVLKPILFRRFCFKARSKNKNYDKDVYSEMQQAWKWVLLVCFGYTGYRNARYGRIECHESITAFSRDILLTALEVAEHAGYEVLHGIIDSLWVKDSKGCVGPVRLSRMISERTGIRMDVEGRYKWIVFLPNKGTGVGALNRYYGLFDNGKLKVRGIELRQHNTPEFLKNIQSSMLKVFSQADNAKEFLGLIPDALDVMLNYGKQIIRGSVDPRVLVFTTRISKSVTQYKVNNLVKSALLQLRDIDINVEPGQSIHYVVTSERSREYKERVCVAELLTDSVEVDVGFYLRQIAKCGESILIPFGYTLEKLESMLQKIRYREKMNVSVLPRVRTC